VSPPTREEVMRPGMFVCHSVCQQDNWNTADRRRWTKKKWRRYVNADIRSFIWIDPDPIGGRTNCHTECLSTLCGKNAQFLFIFSQNRFILIHLPERICNKIATELTKFPWFPFLGYLLETRRRSTCLSQ